LNNCSIRTAAGSSNRPANNPAAPNTNPEAPKNIVYRFHSNPIHTPRQPPIASIIMPHPIGANPSAKLVTTV
jgi:hypothetical protein